MGLWQCISLRAVRETDICESYSLMPKGNQDRQPHLNVEKFKDPAINAKNMVIKHFNVKGNRSALNALI